MAVRRSPDQTFPWSTNISVLLCRLKLYDNWKAGTFVAKVLAKMEKKTTETRKALVDDVGKLKDQASQIAQDVKAHATAHVDMTRERFNEAMAYLQKELSSRPLAILGAGILLGYLFGRRGRRRS